MGELLTRIVDGVRPQAAAKGVRLELDAPGEPCPVAADPHLLTRAVENLLDNAIRHTPSGGSIRVGWKPNADGASFTVTDTGPGIPPHDLRHLFTPLYRGETSRNRRTGGAGLGLATAKRILQAHGGDLTAANASGGGAVFTGHLATDTAAARPPAPELLPSPLGNAR
jgi:signal transduction histidine kinase